MRRIGHKRVKTDSHNNIKILIRDLNSRDLSSSKYLRSRKHPFFGSMSGTSRSQMTLKPLNIAQTTFNIQKKGL